MSTRVKLVGLLAIPVIALVAVAFAFGFGNSSTIHTPTAEAAGVGAMSLTMKGGEKACILPPTSPGVEGDDFFCVAAGNNFTVVTVIDKAPPTGWIIALSWIDYDDGQNNLTYVKPGGGPRFGLADSFGTDKNPDLNCFGNATVDGQVVAGETVNVACQPFGIPVPPQQVTGQFFDVELTCSSTASENLIKMVPSGDAVAGGNGTALALPDGSDIPSSDELTVRCQIPPTPTITLTPTETSTATPTNTPVSEPPFVKSPALQNLFLTRQGTKIPPVQCVGPQGSNDTAVLEMGLGVPIAQLDPKGSGKVVDLGAFEFEVHYDAQKVCVEIQQAQASITMTCFIQDDVTKSVLEGVARIGCVTVGKKLDVNGIWSIAITGAGGLLGSNCVVFIQEAPVGIPTFPFPVKGAMIVTGPPGVDLQPSVDGDQNCVGTTGTFGWVSIPGLAPYDNQTGDFTAVIPCDEPNLGFGCSADGGVAGNFFQEPTTLEMSISATFVIPAIVPAGSGNELLITDGVISGSRTQRLALDLATIIVRPQPDVYSQAIPAQDNGVVVQLNNVGCEIADQQGHPIAHFSCGDADVTIRYLEGDVEPDCVVNAIDAQAIAFRWGASKGTLLFLDRFNLEPFGTQSDNDIDIKDLQAVYGRIGSGCGRPIDNVTQDADGVVISNDPDGIQDVDPVTGEPLFEPDPHPPQPPVNPKA